MSGYFQLELINNAKLGIRSDDANIIIARINDECGEYFDWVDDSSEERHRRLAIHCFLEALSDYPNNREDITYRIVTDTRVMDVTISLTEDQRSLIWYVLKSLSNERAGTDDYDMLMEHATTSDINAVLESFIAKTGQLEEQAA